MKEQIREVLIQILVSLGVTDVTPEVDIPTDAGHGDYSTNIALVLAKTLKRKPLEIAEEIVKNIQYPISNIQSEAGGLNTNQHGQKGSGAAKHKDILQAIEKIEVVAPGFINFHLAVPTLIKQLTRVLEDKEAYGRRSSKLKVQSSKKEKNLLRTSNYEPLTKRIMVEFAHPNTHKVFHIGHLRNISTGESIIRLLEAAGNEVIRVNYQGDVGMHIAKCLYGILQASSVKRQASRIIADWKDKPIGEKVDFLGKAYVAGNKAYAENEEAKKDIGKINMQIYAKDLSVWDLYKTTRQWSLDYFETIYKRVGSHYDRYYFESEVYESGKKNVLNGLEKGIFIKSDGAIIFPGEKFGLHNRVFITSEVNATYEGKDMGLGPLQFSEYHPDLIIHVVGPEQASYFQVVFEALAQLFPETRGKEYHLIYGWVKLKHGKMSSRSGNVVLGEWLIEEAKEKIYNILEKSRSKDNKNGQPASVRQLADSGEAREEIAEKAAIAAVKYSFLKVSTQQQISFDIEESVSFEGDSGPYLQYTYARARSVLRKADTKREASSGKREENNASSPLLSLSGGIGGVILNIEEKEVLRMLYKFPEIVSSAAVTYSPSVVCKYLYELASAFNTFYNKHSILGAAKEVQSSKFKVQSNEAKGLAMKQFSNETTNFRLFLTAATAQVLKNGLYLLGIETLERM